MVIIVAAGVAAAAMPPVPYFSQCDSRWGSDKLGGDGPTICSQGCALTSAAMVMAYYGVDTDPKRLNAAIGRGGYDAGYNIYWSAVRNVCHDEINQIEYSPGTVKPFNTTVLNNQLDAGHPVIVNVGGHFVVVTGRSDGTYYINDPISSAKSTLDDYPSRVGMHIYSGNPPDINKPRVGDWNGNGTDTTGIYNYTTANFSLDSGLNISFGISGDIPITGDWNGDGYDTIGVFRPSTAQFFLDYDNDGVSDMNATFGVIGDIPVAGDWDGDSDDNIGVYRPGTGKFFLEAGMHEVLSSKMIYVDDDFSDDPSNHTWDTIQEGVDDAADGDTVIVYAGEYVENVDVNKSIMLEGEGADVVTVWAADAEDHVFTVTASWVNISGFTATGATTTHYYNAGICLNGVDHCNIFENIASNNEIGINLRNSKNNTLTGNTANSNNRGSGISLVYDSSNNTLTNNNASDNEQGIYLWNSKNNTLTGNTANSNRWYGIGMWDSSNSTLTGNTANSNNECGIHLGCSSNYNTLTNNIANSNNCDGILLSYSSNSTLTNNTANSNSMSGINLQFLSNNTLTSNTANSNDVYGIRLWNSKNNTLTSNTANSNNRDGINLLDSKNNTLTSNTANSNNDYGINLYYSSNNNTLYHNNLINNTDHNAYDTCTNTWDSGTEGNYYSDYTGTDNNTDGIGDDPHPIPGGTSIDRFPLMQPWAGDTPQKGDLNGDDQITPADAAIALAIAAGGSASCDPAMLAAADVSGDHRVTSLDALMILQAAAGAIEL
jgi:parallel beta-helix repeat protein